MYYRFVFNAERDANFDPVAMGMTLGLIQGIVSGIAIGLVVVLSVALSHYWRGGCGRNESTRRLDESVSLSGAHSPGGF